jgi:hypothetical protein
MSSGLPLILGVGAIRPRLQDLNRLLFQQYSGRKFFVYNYDGKKQPILREIVPHEAFEAGD